MRYIPSCIKAKGKAFIYVKLTLNIFKNTLISVPMHIMQSAIPITHTHTHTHTYTHMNAPMQIK